MWGFENVYTVPEQMIKDGNFPTVVSPNPENAEALTMALNLAKEIDADLVMASDPDADRVGIACKNDKGEWVLINGNQTCLMYLYYIITQYNKLGKMTGNEFCVKLSLLPNRSRRLPIRITLRCSIATPVSNGLPVKFVCVKARRNTSAVVKKAMASWPKTLSVIKMLFLLAA